MVKFDESKVINALHKDKAEIGKKYFYADELLYLKRNVEDYKVFGKLAGIDMDYYEPFTMENGTFSQFLYPCEEPPKKRMTNRMLGEWVAGGNGMYSRKDSSTIRVSIICGRDSLNEEVDEEIVICSWDSDEWVEPTVDIYEKDCKGGKK